MSTSVGQEGCELTIVLDEAEEPPRLAAAGAARWTKRKVVMNGADP